MIDLQFLLELIFRKFCELIGVFYICNILYTHVNDEFVYNEKSIFELLQDKLQNNL